MKRLLTEYRLHEHTEALFLLSLGLITQVLDGSPLDLKDRWDMAWKTEFPREYFSVFMQRMIKTVLSVIIFVRCLTSAFYVLFGLIVFFCIVRETAPKLMLPWLFIAGLKSVLLTFLETLTGVYVCSALGKIRKPCLEFVISKAIELFFSIYLWVCIRSIHKDLEQYEDDRKEEELLSRMVLHRVNFRRRRARSMIDESTLSKTANVNYFELKDVPNMIFDMLKTEEELSQDSLFSPGMMLTSVSNMGSFDYLKTSLSLGELGYLDLNSFQVVGLDDERHLSPCERAMKFLKITKDDIRAARARKSKGAITTEPVNISTLLKKKTKPIYDRLPREKEVFIANIPSPSNVREMIKIRNKPSKIPGDMLTHIDYKCDEESRTSEEFISMEEEDEDEDEELKGSPINGEVSPDFWFMTNRTSDEMTRPWPLESHYVKRSDNYERLYRQDFMSVIGPEVFIKASKLMKLTSLSDINSASKKTLEVAPSTPSVKRFVEFYDEADDPEQPSTSRGPKLKRRIMFEDHPEEPTTMPLSVILTNFPLKFDSKITQCEAIYYRETVTNAATAPESDSSLPIPSGCSVAEEVPERQSKQKRNYHKSREIRNWREVDPMPLNLLQRESTNSEVQNFSVIGSPSTQSRLSEQITFTQNLMRRPIKDVLNYYYRLRELDKAYTKYFKRTCSDDSISVLKEILKRKLKNSCERLVDSMEISQSISRSSTEGESRESVEDTERTLADCQTQVRYAEQGLRSYVSSETIELGVPKTEKLNSNRLLLPLYLFGNTTSGWSSNSIDADGKCKLRSRSDTHAENSSRFGASKLEKPSCSSFQGRTTGRSVCFRSALPTFPANDFCCLSKDIQQDSVPVPETEESIGSTESDESLSLFHSKTADPTSPLLDMRRFIYPDHIHYSYKNVKKKGLDVEFNGDLPLLMHENLTLNTPRTVKLADFPPDPQTGITRRPMDLTFANSEQFTGRESEKPSTSYAGENGLNRIDSGLTLSDNREHKCIKHGRIDCCKKYDLENTSSTDIDRTTGILKHTKKNKRLCAEVKKLKSFAKSS